jgi:hypothetical protein
MVFIFTLSFSHLAYAKDDIYGSAHLTYTSTETKTDGEEDDSWQFNQVYNLGVTKAFTPKVGFTALLDVNVTETDEEKTTRLAPDLRLDMTNEYFDANTGYRLNERGLDIVTMTSDEDRHTTESWNANLSTKSERYPRIRLRYNEDKDYDHLAVHETDTKTTNFSGNADYTYRFVNFNYEYRNNTSDDYVTESTQETDIHEGRVNFRKSFWDNKVTSSGSYSLTNRETETKTGGQDVPVDEIQRANDGLYFENPVPPNSVIQVKLTSESELVDGNTTTNVPANINIGTNTNWNIGLELDPVEVEKIFLYTSTPTLNFSETSFVWDVYSSSDNDTWTLITSGASFDYDVDENRFEISFTETKARYFKVVNTSNDGFNLFVTEIEAYDVTTFAAFTTTDTERTTETILASLGLRPIEWLSFTYDFTQDKQETDPDDETTRRYTHNVSGRVERELHKYLTTWAQYRRRWEYDSEADDTTTDTYLLHFLSSPLETLDTDLSFNHTVLKEESETRSRSSSALFQVVARLREGAQLDVDANITRSENLVSESETTTKSIDSNLRLELTRMLTAEIEYNRNWTETDQPSGDTTRRTSYGKTTLYWRPSHDFYLRASFSIDRDETLGDETTQQQYNMSWLMTEKIQLDMGYTLDKNDTDRSIYSSDLSWDLSRILTLRFGYDWSRQKTDTTTEMQTVTADLSARF